MKNIKKVKSTRGNKSTSDAKTQAMLEKKGKSAVAGCPELMEA